MIDAIESDKKCGCLLRDAVARANMDELNTNLEIKEVQSQLAGVLSQPHSNLTVTLFRNYLYTINRVEVLQ